MITWAIFLSALIAVESGGDSSAIGDDGEAIGALQIHQAVVTDVNRIYAWNYRHSDMKNEYKARHVAIHYLRFWGAQHRQTTDQQPDWEVYARIWNGGPRGWEKTATEGYWRKVQAALKEEQ